MPQTKKSTMAKATKPKAATQKKIAWSTASTTLPNASGLPACRSRAQSPHATQVGSAPFNTSSANSPGDARPSPMRPSDTLTGLRSNDDRRLRAPFCCRAGRRLRYLSRRRWSSVAVSTLPSGSCRRKRQELFRLASGPYTPSDRGLAVWPGRNDSERQVDHRTAASRHPRKGCARCSRIRNGHRGRRSGRASACAHEVRCGGSGGQRWQSRARPSRPLSEPQRRLSHQVAVAVPLGLSRRRNISKRTSVAIVPDSHQPWLRNRDQRPAPWGRPFSSAGRPD
jgi:hypothetical protein